MVGTGVLDRFAAVLPLTAETPRITLCEGDTPLLPAARLGQWIGVDELYLKFEGANPTGSFKDRGMVVAVAKALEAGSHAVVCASTGNTAASAAAYAAHAGIQAVVLLPGASVARGKIAQAVMYGARIVVVNGNFDHALDVARDAADRFPLALVNSVNPFRIEGQTTAAFEICESLGDAPALLALPVGNGGNITAYHLGFQRCADSRRATRMPRLIGAQAAGAAPLVLGHPIEEPETVATAIRIGRPATWQPALDAARQTDGRIVAVSDDAILEAWRNVARLEGVFCEPASAAGIAALRQLARNADVHLVGPCVCVLTGNGLKDPETALGQPYEQTTIEASADALAAALHL